jgi:putative endonuclease
VPRTRESRRSRETETARRTTDGVSRTNRVGAGTAANGCRRVVSNQRFLTAGLTSYRLLSGGVHYVYVLECADGSLYTGYTTDVARRVAEHNAGEGAKYTRGRTPVDPVHIEAFETRSAAMSREYEIKQLSRPEKDRLVADGTAE